MKNSVCCAVCDSKAKLLQVAGGIEWWRCTVPSCGHLFSAWVKAARSRSELDLFPIPATAQAVSHHEETL
jgi:hypothetical protein